MATPEIRGFFSKEHGVLVFLICFCLGWLYKTDRTLQKLLIQQAEIKADIKVLTYRLNQKIPQDEKLASLNFYGCKGKSQLQTSNTLLACRFGNRERIAKGKHRIY